MPRRPYVRLVEANERPGGGLWQIKAPRVDDDAADLYDLAYGPGPISRPLHTWRYRRPVDEWDDPIINGVILKVDALAQVEGAKKRIAARVGWGDKTRGPTKAESLAGHEHWLSAQEVADRLETPVQTVRGWRRRGYGPHSEQFGSWVRWDPAAVEAWADSPAGRRNVRRARTPHVIVRWEPTHLAYWNGRGWTRWLADAKRYSGAGPGWYFAEVLQDGNVDVLPAPS